MLLAGIGAALLLVSAILLVAADAGPAVADGTGLFEIFGYGGLLAGDRARAPRRRRGRAGRHDVSAGTTPTGRQHAGADRTSGRRATATTAIPATSSGSWSGLGLVLILGAWRS